MRLRQLTDAEVFKAIRSNDRKALIHLFERNLVSALNTVEKYDIPDEKVHASLEYACIQVWEFFLRNIWRESQHKIDFMVIYLFIHEVKKREELSNLKNRYRFDDLDQFIDDLAEDYNPKEYSLFSFIRRIPEEELDILKGIFFLKWDSDDLAERFAYKDEEQVEALAAKGLYRLHGLVNSSGMSNLRTEADKECASAYIQFIVKHQRKKEDTDTEIKLSLYPDWRPKFSELNALQVLLENFFRFQLRKEIKDNAAVKLTGNIWGNKWSLISLLFILIMGLLIWLIDQHPEWTDNRDSFPVDSTIIHE